MPVIPHDELRRIGRRVFAAGGSSEEEAGIIADHLVEANLKGHDSHGVGMIPSYLRNLHGGKAAANEKGHVVSDSGAFIVYDGARGYGQIVAREATQLGIARAKENGVAVVALRNAHHIGRVGTYGEMCAAEGLLSISFVNITDQRPAVAPWRGGDARFGTNPVTIALPGPSPERPIVADMATSRIAMGKVRVARNKGEKIAAKTLLGPDGQPTDDPNVMYKRPRGALLTFAEHKGYALAFICEMLAGAITGSGTMRPERQDTESVTNGMLLVVIDPGRITDRAWLAEEVKAMTDYVTASPPRKSGEKVLIPGDPERLMRQKRIAEGVPSIYFSRNSFNAGNLSALIAMYTPAELILLTGLICRLPKSFVGSMPSEIVVFAKGISFFLFGVAESQQVTPFTEPAVLCSCPSAPTVDMNDIP